MSALIEVVYIDGSTEIVSPEEAAEYLEEGLLMDPVSSTLALTLEDVYGDDFN